MIRSRSQLHSLRQEEKKKSRLLGVVRRFFRLLCTSNGSFVSKNILRVEHAK